jgi:hypothetical protein
LVTIGNLKATHTTLKTVSAERLVYQDTIASNNMMKGTKVPGKL